MLNLYWEYFWALKYINFLGLTSFLDNHEFASILLSHVKFQILHSDGSNYPEKEKYFEIMILLHGAWVSDKKISQRV